MIDDRKDSPLRPNMVFTGIFSTKQNPCPFYTETTYRLSDGSIAAGVRHIVFCTKSSHNDDLHSAPHSLPDGGDVWVHWHDIDLGTPDAVTEEDLEKDFGPKDGIW